MRFSIFRSIFVLMLLAVTSCSTKEVDIDKINGYWQIDEASGQDGETKKYGASLLVDFIEMDGNRGTKKKLSPRLDGTFIGGDFEVTFHIVEEDGKTFMKYKHLGEDLLEEITLLNDENFEILTNEGHRYLYRRFKP